MFKSKNAFRMIAKAMATFMVVSGLSVAAAIPASAHATVQMYGEKATAGGYGAVFIRIPHAAADRSTVKVEVQIPEGVTAVKPQRLSGWSESVTKGADGKTVTSVTWSNGSLPDTSFQDFGIQVKFPKDAGTVYFKTVQTLDDGSTIGWVEIPAAGVDSHSLAKPSPSVTTVAAAPAHGAPAHGSETKPAHGSETMPAHGESMSAAWKGDFVATMSTRTAKLVVDSSIADAGKVVKFHLVRSTGEVMIGEGKLDSRGDLVKTISLKRTGTKGWSIKDGDTVKLYINGMSMSESKI
jgi:uncharacterized protein YcnI